MVEVKHLLDLAASFRNIAVTAQTDEARAELLRAAAEYDRRAKVRRSSLFAVRATGEKK
jgi:hypothetical protein